LLYRVLLALILVEIVHTVVLSLRAHHLVAQPFIIVGLVAVIRKILVVLSGTGTVPPPQLALLIAMVFVFVAALLAVTWFDRRWRGDDPAAPIRKSPNPQQQRSWTLTLVMTLINVHDNETTTLPAATEAQRCRQHNRSARHESPAHSPGECSQPNALHLAQPFPDSPPTVTTQQKPHGGGHASKL
jgi:uncharacterized membrane protein (DUF373 family)